MRLIKDEKKKQQSVVAGFNKRSCVGTEFDPLILQTTFQQRQKLTANIIANSDGEESDRDSYSSDDEIEDTEQNIINSVSESNSCKELSDHLNNLSVSEQSRCSQIVGDDDFTSEQNLLDVEKTDEADLIPRSPINVYNGNKSIRTLGHPYSLACLQRSNYLQNGGKIVAENSKFVEWPDQINISQPQIIPQSIINLNNQTSTTVPPPESESPKISQCESYIMFTLDELLKFVENELRELSGDDNKNRENIDSEHAKNESTSWSDNFDNSQSFLNIDSPENDSSDPTYSSSEWSPLSSNCSPALTPIPETIFPNDSYSPSYKAFDPQSLEENDNIPVILNNVASNIPLLSQTDEVNRPVIHLDSNSSNHLLSFIIQNKAINQFAENVNSSTAVQFLLNNKRPTNLVPPSISFQMSKPNDKHIQPIGEIVYDIPTSASQRLYDMVKHPRMYNIYSAQYIKVCLDFKDSPEKLKIKLFNLLKEKRNNLDDRWLSNMYAHIAYIVIINTEEFANILTSKIEGESLLHIACMNFPESPIVARYIAEVMVKLNRNVNEEFNDKNSLIHELAHKGDDHVKLLAELLQVRKYKNCAVFNINCRNNKLQTPLHLAVIAHSSENSCFTTIKHLRDHDAKILQDIDGRTPLHYATLKGCGPNIVKQLLPINASKIVDLQDSQGNTALHLACKNKMYLEKQDEVISMLIANEANSKIPNLKGELPCPGMNFKKTSIRKQYYC